MGILYNRFTPGFTLLPYSDSSKIITYATYENFDASSSTWGDGIAPINRSTNTSWYKDSDAQGFVSFSANSNSISNTSALGNKFTIYEVLKHVNFPEQYSNYDYNLVISRDSQSTSEYLFSPWHEPYIEPGLYDYYCQTTGGIITFSLNTSFESITLDQMHITAAAYQYTPDNRQSRIDAFCNYNSGLAGPTAITSSSLYGVRIAGTTDFSTRCYKFIAVVAEDESQIYTDGRSIVEWNMAVLKHYFGVEYDSPI